MRPAVQLPRLFAMSVVSALCVWTGSPVFAQTAANVAVVINDDSPDSQRIGEHYARTRSLPASNVFHIRVAPQDTIERSVFSSAIEIPIAAAIRRGNLQDSILYLVLTKGVPLRIAGTSGLSGTVSSVDAELTLLYRRMTGETVALDGKIDNPYFLGTRELREALPFSHREHDIYLVTRIDAFTADQALALIDKAQAPAREGRIVLDQIDEDPTKSANRWMAQAAQRLSDQGHGSRVTLESSTKPAESSGSTLGFYSWGASDPAQRRRTTGMTFVPGAIAATLASANGRTFTAPPESWIPSGSSQTATFYAGSSETLVGDLIKDGVTGVSAQVDEPFVLGAVRPEILFPAYQAGFNLAEAFYLATPTLSWTTIIVGDPLCRPFAGKALTSADLESPIDPRTGLPQLFGKRRMARTAAAAPDVPEEALALTLRAETFLQRSDRASARALLEEASKLAPKATGLLLTVAQLNETDGRRDEAIAGYQRIIEIQPTNAVALNNLAYALAVHRKTPAEALPFARRAAALAARNPSVLDTWAWIEHLLGNNVDAARILADAIKIDPDIAEMRMHAATIAAALGIRANAEKELKEALRLDPSLEQRDETRQLQARIASLPPPQ